MNWLSSPLTYFDEDAYGDTDNRDPITGRTPVDENYPLLSVSPGILNGANFYGTIGNSALSGDDNDYFVIDINDGYRDHAGSVLPGGTLRFVVNTSLMSGDDDTNLAIEWRLVDENLSTWGPYGQHAFYLEFIDGSGGLVTLTVPSSGLPSRAYLAFQVIDYGLDNFSHYKIFITLPSAGPTSYTGVGTRAEKFDVHTTTSPVVIKAVAGEDFVWAGQRNDTAFGGASRDIVIGDNGDDILYGDDGAASAGAADQLLGGGDNDTCYGAAGNDYINGEWGNDKLYGGAANDLIYGGLGTDVIAGGDGSDRLWGGSSPTPQGSWFGGPVVVQWNGTTGTAISPEAWTIAGEAQSTDASRDLISGGAGNDFLYGQGGNDVLIGGLGRDVMFGGQGSDVFDFNAVAETGKTPATRDVIRDFTHLVDDIDLSTIDAATGPGNQKFAFIGHGAFKGVKGQLHYRFEGPAKTIVEGDINGDKQADFQIELTGHKLLTAGDFIL